MGMGKRTQRVCHFSVKIERTTLNIDRIKKVAKSLLRCFKTSLSLWSAFAQIEWHDSAVDAGRKVFSMALGMSKEFSADSQRDAILVWHAWIWKEIWQGNAPDALRLILSIESGGPQPVNESNNHRDTTGNISKPTLLKTRRVSVSIQALEIADEIFMAAVPGRTATDNAVTPLQ